MGVRKIEKKKYTANLCYVTWHAACLSVWRLKGRKKIDVMYRDIDGPHCYFYTLVEFLDAGWDIYKIKDQLSVILTGDNLGSGSQLMFWR